MYVYINIYILAINEFNLHARCGIQSKYAAMISFSWKFERLVLETKIIMSLTLSDSFTLHLLHDVRGHFVFFVLFVCFFDLFFFKAIPRSIQASGDSLLSTFLSQELIFIKALVFSYP